MCATRRIEQRKVLRVVADFEPLSNDRLADDAGKCEEEDPRQTRQCNGYKLCSIVSTVEPASGATTSSPTCPIRISHTKPEAIKINRPSSKSQTKRRRHGVPVDGSPPPTMIQSAPKCGIWLQTQPYKDVLQALQLLLLVFNPNSPFSLLIFYKL